MSKHKKTAIKNQQVQPPPPREQVKSFDILAYTVRNLQYVALFGVFLLLLLLCFRTESAVDLGMHIKAGEKILQEKSGIYYDPFTYTVVSHKWIDLACLFQMVVYFIWNSGGILGITLFRCAVFFVIFWLIYKNCAIFGSNLSITVPLILMVIFTCESRFFTRSELFGFLFLNAMLYVLYRYKKGHTKHLWPVIVIQFFWANSHPFFILGWAILLCFLISEFIEKKRIERLASYVLLSIAVSFINPYHYEGVLQPFAAFMTLKGSLYLKVISELLPPFSAAGNGSTSLPSAIVLYAYLIGISLTGILLNFKRQSFFTISVYILFLMLSLSARRNVTLFCFVAVPLTAWNLTQAGSWFANSKYLKVLEIFMLIGVLAFISIKGCEVATNYYYIKDRRFENFGIGTSGDLPVQAAKFAQSQKLDGNMFNHFNFSGTLIWFLFPQQKLFIDGALETMEESHYNYYLQSMEREDSWEECVNKYEINWVIVPCREVNFVQMLYKNKDWALVYFDETAVIFVKNIPRNMELAKNRIRPEENYQVSSQLKEEAFQSADSFWASATPAKRFFNHLFVKQKYPLENINKGNVFAYLGYSGQAEEQYLNAILNGPEYWEGFFNLGMLYFFRGQYQDAMDCYLKVLQINPQHAGASEWLAKCYQHQNQGRTSR